MKGYPKYIGTKQDYINLLADKKLKARALEDLERLYANDDTLIMTTTSLKDPNDKDGEWNQVILPNPSPLYQQKGFKDRAELAKIITKNGGKV